MGRTYRVVGLVKFSLTAGAQVCEVIERGLATSHEALAVRIQNDGAGRYMAAWVEADPATFDVTVETTRRIQNVDGTGFLTVPDQTRTYRQVSTARAKAMKRQAQANGARFTARAAR